MIDGRGIDLLEVAIGGTIKLDRGDPNDVALIRRLAAGKNVTLKVEVFVAGSGGEVSRDENGYAEGDDAQEAAHRHRPRPSRRRPRSPQRTNDRLDDTSVAGYIARMDRHTRRRRPPCRGHSSRTTAPPERLGLPLRRLRREPATTPRSRAAELVPTPAEPPAEAARHLPGRRLRATSGAAPDSSRSRSSRSTTPRPARSVARAI
jgi:hypothetical protein